MDDENVFSKPGSCRLAFFESLRVCGGRGSVKLIGFGVVNLI